MLTEKGYRDRFWKDYPQLRRILEGKERSFPCGVDALFASAFPEDQSLPSTWQGSVDRLTDVLCIARLLREHASDLQDAIAGGAFPLDRSWRTSSMYFVTWRVGLNISFVPWIVASVVI